MQSQVSIANAPTAGAVIARIGFMRLPKALVQIETGADEGPWFHISTQQPQVMYVEDEQGQCWIKGACTDSEKAVFARAAGEFIELGFKQR